ncbi:hypothetical protein LC76P1_00078 [Lysinibacillus phage LC76P1]|nr:hypothetical protein LC76P1_00078 [Lysinibacillus phage LC76P1]
MKWAYIHLRSRFVAFVGSIQGKSNAISHHANLALSNLDNDGIVIQALHDILRLSNNQQDAVKEEEERFAKRKKSRKSKSN